MHSPIEAQELFNQIRSLKTQTTEMRKAAAQYAGNYIISVRRPVTTTELAIVTGFPAHFWNSGYARFLFRERNIQRQSAVPCVIRTIPCDTSGNPLSSVPILTISKGKRNAYCYIK